MTFRKNEKIIRGPFLDAGTMICDSISSWPSTFHSFSTKKDKFRPHYLNDQIITRRDFQMIVAVKFKKKVLRMFGCCFQRFPNYFVRLKLKNRK